MHALLFANMRSEWLPNICATGHPLIEPNAPIVGWSPCACTAAAQGTAR